MRTGRNVLQVLVAQLGWLGFAAAWFYVFHSGSVGPRAWLDVFVIAFVAAAAVLSTLLWVRYNVNIYRRKGPRSEIPHVIFNFSADAEGVAVVADLQALRTARYVNISLKLGSDGTEEKVYEIGSASLSDEEHAACML